MACLCVCRVDDPSALYQGLAEDYDDYLPLHAAWLHHLDTEKVSQPRGVEILTVSGVVQLFSQWDGLREYAYLKLETNGVTIMSGYLFCCTL